MSIAGNILMKINEYSDAKGTYVSVEYNQEQIKFLLNIFKDSKIPELYDVNKIHTTIIYSPDTPYYQIPPKLIGKKIELKNPSYELFGENKDTLVISFTSELLTKRHNEVKEKYKLKPTYPEYKPHITLSEKAGDIDLKNLPVLTDITLNIVIEKSETIK